MTLSWHSKANDGKFYILFFVTDNYQTELIDCSTKKQHNQIYNLTFPSLARTTRNIKTLSTRKGHDAIIISRRDQIHRVPYKISRLESVI